MTETGSVEGTLGEQTTPSHHVVVLGGDSELALRTIVEVGARSVSLVATTAEPCALDGRLEELGLEVDRRSASRWPLLALLRVVDEAREHGCSPPVLVNVAGADRQGASAGTVAGYLRDVPVLDVVEGEPRVLPRLAFTYEETISETKLSILEALDAMDGRADQLKALAGEAGITSSLASYHLRGARGNRGLEELGLVEIEGNRVGELAIRLTGMGRLFARRLIGPNGTD